MLTTDQKGNIAETAIVAAAVKLGTDVYRPVGEGGRYDMIFEVDHCLLRVQCKWAARHDNILIVRCYSSRRSVGGKIVSRPYTLEQVAAFAVYSLDVDKCYLLPADLWPKNAKSTFVLHQRRTIRESGSTGRGTMNSSLHWPAQGP
jgi:PD-(D/E)XK endonuclease